MIWLLRHGEASGDAADDSSRPLTQTGELQARAAGRALARLNVELGACLASPKLRALETARLACEPLAVEVEESEALRGGDFEPAALAAGRGNVLLVGHEPDFSRAIHAVTGARIELEKGGLAAIDGPALLTLLRPGDLSAIAG